MILFCLFVGIMTIAGCANDDGAISSTSERVEASGPSDGEVPATSRQADRIRICHRTNSDANPYVAMEVSERALAGHLDHPEDIIPPGPFHPGQNFPSPIWDNNCVTPTPTATPEPTPTVTATPEPTPTVTATPEPTPTATATPVEQTAGSIEEAVQDSEDSASSATATPDVATPSPPAPSELGDAGDELARTGASSSELGLLAGLLMAAGTAMVAVARRIATAETR